ncbi:hypothetical protein Clacol_009704 [Clathrus columnatus]|uniref:Cytochrome P450 n=1 Tax=Clathrus columnatus TaxID=1419009 RepID=A0AAV5ANQ3_9AGAM|nr:hypothetical protein Clacol_009704 [Clathrus columnatus]
MLNAEFILSDPIIYTIAICSTIWFILFQKSHPQRVESLPPGPKPLPILGNAHQIPTKNIQEVYSKWRKLYGGIVHVTVGKQHIVLLNTPRHAFGLLEKQGKIYSHRPSSVMIKMAGLDTTWTLSPYGDTVRHFRKLGRYIMGPQAIGKYEPVQEDEARSFVRALIDSPDELLSHVNRLMSNVILRILYGYSPSPELDAISNAVRHLPVFRRRAKNLCELFQHVHSAPFEMVKKGLDEDIAVGNHSSTNSLCATLLLEGLTGQPGSAGSEHSIKMFLGSIYPPGQETTSATLYMFFFMMGNNPGIQAKARAEIMSITGGHRLPQLSDRTSFVYIMAVFKEVLRYHSAAPLDPFEFKPERFLDIPAKTPDGYPTDPRQYVFGFGRRTCPAIHLAESTLLISIATVLATCDIGPCFNPDGSKIEKFQYTPTLVAHSLPFKCSINAISREIL